MLCSLSTKKNAHVIPIRIRIAIRDINLLLLILVPSPNNSKKNIIHKSYCKSDKRLVDVSISDQGLHLLSEIEPHSLELDNTFSKLDLEEAKELNRLLDKLRR